MQKRGQIAFYIIIAVVMLAIFGYGFYYLIHSNDADRDFTISKSMSLDAQKDVVSNNIQDCLEKRSKEAIDYYGIKDSSEGLIMKYIDTTMDSCVDYNYFKRKGLNVDRGKAQSYVEISEDAVLITLNYAVYIHNEDGTARLDKFEYNLPREVSGTVNPDTQLAENEIKLMSKDGDIDLFIPQGTIVQGLGSDGRISVKMLDKNFDGLQNGVVVGRVVYEGLPDGAKFDPAIQVTIKVKKGDVPVQYDASVLKIAWYDKQNGLWRTYRQSGFHEDDYYYYYSAEVDHFTSIAVVACGVDGEAGTFELRMYNAYLSPVQPLDQITPLVWEDGLAEAKYLKLDKINQESAHCLFLDEKEGELSETAPTNWPTMSMTTELQAVWGSRGNDGVSIPQPAGRIYNIQNLITFPPSTSDAKADAIKKCAFLIRDWDEDDQSTEIASNKITVTPSGNLQLPADASTSCLSKCQEVTKMNIVEFLLTQNLELIKKGELTEEQIIDIFVVGSFSPAGSFLKADGIKDSATLACTYSSGGYSCDSAVAITSFEDTVNSNFYASLKTYGYYLTSSDSFGDDTIPSTKEYIPSEHVGGYAEYKFDTLKDGNACVDAENKPDPDKIDNNLAEADAKLFNPSYQATDGACADGDTLDGEKCLGKEIGTFSKDNNIIISPGDGISCGPGDKCIWTLNNPIPTTGFITGYGDVQADSIVLGKVHEGTNIIGVWVKNKGDTGDADAFANAVFVLKGTGIFGQEDCETSLQDRINYLCGCTGTCDSKDSAVNAELNCLARLRVPDGAGALSTRTQSLCSEDASQCYSKLDASTGLAKADEGRTAGGICLSCPTIAGEDGESTLAQVQIWDTTLNGGAGDWKLGPIPANTQGTGGRCRICPGRMGASDTGCLCGNYVFDFSIQSESYCCGGEIVQKMPESGCWQTSPLALKPAVESPPAGDGLIDGSKCFVRGEGAKGTCITTSPYCCKAGDPNCVANCAGDTTCIDNCAYTTTEDDYTCHDIKAECNPNFIEDSAMAKCDPDAISSLDCTCGGILMEIGKFCCSTGENEFTIVDFPFSCPEKPDSKNLDENCANIFGMCKEDCGSFSTAEELGIADPCKDSTCCINQGASKLVCCTYTQAETEKTDMKPIKECLTTLAGTINPYSNADTCGKAPVVVGGCPAGPLTAIAGSGYTTGTTPCTCKGNPWDPEKASGDHKYCCTTGFSKNPCPGEGSGCGDGNRCDISAPFCCTPDRNAEFSSCHASSCTGVNSLDTPEGYALCPKGDLSLLLPSGKQCWCDKILTGGSSIYCCDVGGSLKSQTTACLSEPGTIGIGGPCASGLGTCGAGCVSGEIDLNLITSECVTNTHCCSSASNDVCCKVSSAAFNQILSLSNCNQAGNTLVSVDTTNCVAGKVCCSYNNKDYCTVGTTTVSKSDDCQPIINELDTYGVNNADHLVSFQSGSDCDANCYTFNLNTAGAGICQGVPGIIDLPGDQYPLGWRICDINDKLRECESGGVWGDTDKSCDASYNYYCFDSGDGKAFCSSQSSDIPADNVLPLGICPLYNGEKDWHLGEKDYGCTCGTDGEFKESMDNDLHCCFITLERFALGFTDTRGDCEVDCNTDITRPCSESDVGDCSYQSCPFRCGADKKFHYDASCPD